MWTYEQLSGALVGPDGAVFHKAYSGLRPDGVNQPEKQDVKDIGPIPRGWYTIEKPRDKKGKPYYMPLTPDPSTNMFGRSGFQIHGDNKTHTASTGCIVVSPKSQRERVWASGDRRLRVVKSSSFVTSAKLSKAPAS